MLSRLRSFFNIWLWYTLKCKLVAFVVFFKCSNASVILTFFVSPKYCVLKLIDINIQIFILRNIQATYYVWKEVIHYRRKSSSLFSIKSFSTEAVAQRWSVKKLFLKISQNSQENTCARVSFLIKLQAQQLHVD